MVQSLIKEFCPHFSKLYLFFYVLTFCLGPSHLYNTHDNIWRGFVGLLSRLMLIEVIPLLVFLDMWLPSYSGRLSQWFSMFTLKIYLIASFFCRRFLI